MRSAAAHMRLNAGRPERYQIGLRMYFASRCSILRRYCSDREVPSRSLCLSRCVSVAVLIAELLKQLAYVHVYTFVSPSIIPPHPFEDDVTREDLAGMGEESSSISNSRVVSSTVRPRVSPAGLPVHDHIAHVQVCCRLIPVAAGSPAPEPLARGKRMASPGSHRRISRR